MVDMKQEERIDNIEILLQFLCAVIAIKSGVNPDLLRAAGLNPEDLPVYSQAIAECLERMQKKIKDA